MSVAVREFLKDLPIHNEQNFSLFNTENGIRTSLKRPSVYLPTEDYPAEQIIVSEKRNILLRYLQHQWDKKTAGQKKREHTNDTNGERKRQRLDRDNI